MLYLYMLWFVRGAARGYTELRSHTIPERTLNRRGGKRKSFTWNAFCLAIKRLGVAYPRITERKRQHVVFA
jgi:hypothetical protein